MKLVCEKCGNSFEYHRRKKYCLDCVPKRIVYSSEEEKIKARRKARVISTQKRRNNIKNMAIEYKGGKCQICGYDKCNAALDFHHLDPTKKDFAIGSKGYTRAWKSVQAELDKCILVCANCHREIHNGLIVNI